VERRKYRFRILNGAVARFFKIALSDGSPMIQIANDGNLLPRSVKLRELDEQGIAERYDIVIDFSRYRVNDKVWMVNLAEHQSGVLPSKDLSLAEALSGKSDDPCVPAGCSSPARQTTSSSSPRSWGCLAGATPPTGTATWPC
jgi:manganese oxidase